MVTVRVPNPDPVVPIFLIGLLDRDPDSYSELWICRSGSIRNILSLVLEKSTIFYRFLMISVPAVFEKIVLNRPQQCPVRVRARN
jgi:hypothetical protein